MRYEKVTTLTTFLGLAPERRNFPTEFGYVQEDEQREWVLGFDSREGRASNCAIASAASSVVWFPRRKSGCQGLFRGDQAGAVQ
jgi:hypothetical protein